MNQLIDLYLYFENLKTLEGVVIPALISAAILQRQWQFARRKPLLFMLLTITVSISAWLSRWDSGGLHVFTAGLVCWPLMVMRFPDDFPWEMAYPMAFLSVLTPDICKAGALAAWRDGWFFGIGGGGFHDGDFIAPALTLVAAFTIHLCQKRGMFAFGVNKRSSLAG